MFDTPAASYEVSSGSAELKTIPGVKSVETLQAVEGSPVYCIILETDDEKDKEVVAKFREMQKQYSEHLSNVSMRAYRMIG